MVLINNITILLLLLLLLYTNNGAYLHRGSMNPQTRYDGYGACNKNTRRNALVYIYIKRILLTRASGTLVYMCIANFDTITMDKDRRGGGMGGVGVKGISSMGVRGGAVAAAEREEKKSVD